jgi:hypothetical protein
MKNYHICYTLAKELCTGVNIEAKSYIDALNKFKIIYNGQEIIYITVKDKR